MDKILVTGAAGFIGSVVVESLVDKGYDVIGIDNFQEGKKNAVNKKIKFFQGDVGDKLILESIFNSSHIDYVFHFAAETTIEFSMTQPNKYFYNNVVNGMNLLEVMRKHSVQRMIYSSTAATYGEPVYNPIDEKHPQVPINSYGESKLIFEKILEWYHKAYGLKYNLFRYFNASGATELNGEDRKHESHLLPMAFSVLTGNRNQLQIFGTDYPTKDGTCVRDYVHVADIADAHILGMRNLDTHPNGKYNLGSGTGFTVQEVVETIEKITLKTVNKIYSGRRIGDPAVLVASNELAKKELMWNPQRSNLDTIISSAYSWILNHPNGYEN